VGARAHANPETLSLHPVRASYKPRRESLYSIVSDDCSLRPLLYDQHVSPHSPGLVCQELATPARALCYGERSRLISRSSIHRPESHYPRTRLDLPGHALHVCGCVWRVLARYCVVNWCYVAGTIKTGELTRLFLVFQDFKSATTGVAAKAMRNELNRMVAEVKDHTQRKVCRASTRLDRRTDASWFQGFDAEMQGFFSLFNRYLSEKAKGQKIEWEKIKPPAADQVVDYNTLPQVDGTFCSWGSSNLSYTCFRWSGPS
jgi:hypothetical protein